MSTAQHDDSTPDQHIPTFEQAVAQRATEYADAATDGTVQYASEAHQHAWERYRAHPDTVAAQATYTQRQNDLQPVRDMVEKTRELLEQVAQRYNGQMTEAHIAFQAAAHAPLYDLTQTLRALDGDGPPPVVRVVATPE